MNDDQKRALTLEKTLLRYNVALENGDFESIASILLEAEIDSQLEKMILELNDFYAAEIAENSYDQDAAQIRDLIEAHLLSAQAETVLDAPSLTVGNVIARIHADAALRAKIDRESLAATRPHQNIEVPLPDVLSVSKVSRLLQDLGIEVGRRFQTLFRDTALYMRMGRNQGMAHMAATRPQQEASYLPLMGYLAESKASYAALEPPLPAAALPNDITAEDIGPTEKGPSESGPSETGQGEKSAGEEGA